MKKLKLKQLDSVCGICGASFPPRVDYFDFVSQKSVSDRIKQRHPLWLEWFETCPTCVDSALRPRFSFRLPLIPRLMRNQTLLSC